MHSERWELSLWVVRMNKQPDSGIARIFFYEEGRTEVLLAIFEELFDRNRRLINID